MDDDLPSRARRNWWGRQSGERERVAQWHAAWRRRLGGVLVVLLSLGISGCDTAPRPLAALPPQPASKARFYFFREMSPYMRLARTEVLLNGLPAGTVAPGSAIYRDVAPGLYEVGVRTGHHDPSQFKMVAIEAGTSTYVRVESQPILGRSGEAVGGNTFVVAIVDPVIARRQIEDLRLSDG